MNVNNAHSINFQEAIYFLLNYRVDALFMVYYVCIVLSIVNVWSGLWNAITNIFPDSLIVRRCKRILKFGKGSLVYLTYSPIISAAFSHHLSVILCKRPFQTMFSSLSILANLYQFRSLMYVCL